MATEAVIFDWAGTTIDYGGTAVYTALQQTFADCGLHLTMPELRAAFTGDATQTLQQLCRQPAIAAVLTKQHSNWELLAHQYRARLLPLLPAASVLKPGIKALCAFLSANDIPYGATTTYDAAMLAIVQPLAAAAGFCPQVNITHASAAGAHRPAPTMNRLAMQALKVHNPAHAIIVGDTIADVVAAQNAGANAIGVLEGATVLGYAQPDWEALDQDAQRHLKHAAKTRYTNAGAEVIIDSASDLLTMIRQECDLEAVL